MSTLNAHFGIGQATAITKVIVKWPSGIVDVINNVNPNTTLNVVEGTFLDTKEVQTSQETFTIYPNPTHDIISFKTANDFIPVDAKVYEMSGRMVLQTKVERNSISIKQLNTGNYLLIVMDKNGKTYSQKVTKK
jgi:hypothetical protein